MIKLGIRHLRKKETEEEMEWARAETGIAHQGVL